MKILIKLLPPVSANWHASVKVQNVSCEDVSSK